MYLYYRTKSKELDFEDLDKQVTYDLNEIPEKLYSNDIPTFPFPTVFDFISEINRPVDPYTMANLKYNFKVQV